MGTTDVNIPIVQVPQDDGSIAEAIAQLDNLISAWASEVGKVHSALAGIAADQAARDSAKQPASPAVDAATEHTAGQSASSAPQQTSSTPSAELHTQHVEVPKFTAADAARVTPPAPSATKLPRPAEAERDSSEDEGHKVSRFRRLFRGKNDSPADDTTRPATDTHGLSTPPAAGSGSAELDEDEALLASLDPKVAKAIRIKRRLCNGRKSVRELLEEG